MIWDDLKKRFNEVLKNPADFDREAVVTIKQELEQFALENLGASEAIEADTAASQLHSVLRNYQPTIINRYVASSHRAESEPTHDVETRVDKEYIKQAEDAYYNSEWAKAIELCQQILKEDPTNSWAREHIEKAQINQLAVDEDAKIPREAKQYYRRARSLIIVGQQKESTKLLERAIEIAEKNGVSFTRAEELLGSMEQFVLATEFKEKVRQAIENFELTEALEPLKAAIKLDPTDVVLEILFAEISILINLKRDIGLLRNADSCEPSLFQEILDKLYAIKHPWLINAKIKDQIQKDLYDIREEKSANYVKYGEMYLGLAREALYLSVMSELSNKAIEAFERALKCGSRNVGILDLINKAKVIKDRVDSIINGDEKSFLDFLQGKAERQKTISEITKRMDIVVTEFDEDSEEYKSFWKQLEGLFDKKSKSLTASDDRIAVVLTKIDAEIKNSRDRRPWGAALVISILLVIISAVLLALNPKRTIIPFSTDFPADLVLYASLFGSVIRVIVELSDRRRTKWVDTVRLAVLRPLIGVGVTLLIVLFVYSGLGKIMSFSPTMGFWGFISLSSIIGYSDSIMNKIIQVLEKGMSIKV